MVQWLKRLPASVQRAALAVIFFFGGTSTACRLSPMVCDPAPPPSSTPMVCDPPPPPSPTHTATPTPTAMVGNPTPSPAKGTPMICDPAPVPATPMGTVAPGQRFSGRVLGILQGTEQDAPAIRGTIVDEEGRPLSGITVVVEDGDWVERTVSDRNGAFFLLAPEPGTYLVSVEGDEQSAIPLELDAGEQAIIEWLQTWDESSLPLPLAEVRTVAIIHLGGLAFSARSPWPGAHCGWSVSGGTLLEDYERVVWQPPTEPGRYLIQVVANWGRLGLAVDATVLVVGEDGRTSLSA